MTRSDMTPGAWFAVILGGLIFQGAQFLSMFPGSWFYAG
jgi:hypothetical protein